MLRRSALALLLAAATEARALGPEPIRAAYDVTLAGVTIGEVALSLEGAPGRYAVRLDGDWRFLFWSGDAEAATEGRADGAAGAGFAPDAYRARFEGPMRVFFTEIAFGAGAPRAAFRADPPFDADGEEEPRVPILDAHLEGATDPISAFLIPASSAAEACSASLRVFSGAVRFDVALAPAGPTVEPGVAPCRGDYRPVSGHRVESAAVDRLRAAGLDLGLFEIAPGLWAPHRIAAPTSFGELAFRRRDR